MRVLKFGGTSVATSENIKIIKSIVGKKVENEPIVMVVSALGGVTNTLTKIGELASTGNAEYESLLNELEERHVSMCKELLSPNQQGEAIGAIKIHLNQLEDITRGIFWIKELSTRTKDLLLSYGEVLSSTILHKFFNAEGIKTELADPREFILTDNQHGNARVNRKQTFSKIKTYFQELEKLSICPGFIASDQKGEITTLGRGGSDYSASLIAAGCEASYLEIWTDVNGLMTADPRFVRGAHTIDKISYEDAMELSHFGAKVIYPPTIQPALDKGIAIYIKNTMEPEAEGTLISEHKDEEVPNGDVIKGLSCIRDIALINLKGSGMVGIPNFSHRLFKCLSDRKINIILITQASSEHSICIAIDSNDANESKLAIEAEFEFEMAAHKIDPLELEMDLSIIALVGSKMKKQVGVSGKLFSTLGRNGVNIRAIAQGSSERNISVVIDSYQVKKALNSLHESFFLSQNKRINLFIVGVGNVGSAFIDQIQRQQNFLLENHHLNVKVVGMANSRKAVFNEDGIDLENWKTELENSSEPFEIEAFRSRIQEMNLRNSLFIDNTDSADIASSYLKFLENSISVVTPNKVACASEYKNYKELKRVAARMNSKFLFETNVGAGLPIISTINDLIKSGDKIHRLEAVLSGSLNFIFNTYDGSQSFGDVVRLAKTEGYTEPDPRIDLSGIDVMRKLLILIRESGTEMEMDQIQSEPFISENTMGAESVDGFLTLLDSDEESFRSLHEEAQSKGAKIKYVASYIGGIAKAGLQMVDEKHPFYNLDGKDNIILLYTDRYEEQPLVIKGAGAGAEVTATGIFADVLKFANR